MEAAHALTRTLPLDQIDVAKVARRAGVSWPTAKHHLGNKTELRRRLVRAYPELEHAATSRDALLAAAAHIFARDGYAGATLDAIGAGAGVTKGAVYWHFRNKTELFLALIEARDARTGLTASADVAALFATHAPKAALTRALATQFGRAASDVWFLRLYIEFVAASRERTVRKRLAASYQHQLAILAEVVTGLRNAGALVQDVPVESIARVLLLLLDGFTLRALVSLDPVSHQEFARELADILWQGLSRWTR